MEKRIYMAIDLKSFYASVECKERNLDPLTTNLVVADESRTEKTICLAVSPSLKKYGIPGRARLFEVIQKVKEVNEKRLRQARLREFKGYSYNDLELEKDLTLGIKYIVAPPRMAFYIDYSTKIYSIYMKYFSSEDVHVYSIDEVFIDVTSYLHKYNGKVDELAKMVIKDIFDTTGITATAGIGTNLYLCKVAMDIVAKHTKPDKDGVRIAKLNELMYRKLLWNHKPLTDFWRVGKGYAKKLEAEGIYTMGDIAKVSVGGPKDYYNEDLLYQLFGVNAELLIDHAWGYEPCTIKEIKKYKPERSSIGSGQVLSCPYTFDKGRIVVKEIIESLSLTLVEKALVCDQIVLTIGYDKENLQGYHGELMEDRYGRKIPKHAHGTAHLNKPTASLKKMQEALLQLYDQKVNPNLTIRRINISLNNVVQETSIEGRVYYDQLDLFHQEIKEDGKELEKEKQIQLATIAIKKKYGKNALLKGSDLQEGATTIERNETIGGHKA